MAGTGARVVVLVEGDSDRVALTTLARRQGRDLAADGVAVVVMHGITNLRASVARYGPLGLGLPVAGLYDAPEEAVVRRGLTGAGLAPTPGTSGLRERGFFGCSADLEDELVRAVGTDGVEAVIEAAGEARSLRLLAAMPAYRHRTQEAVLRRFLASRSGRKARYAELLVAALPPGHEPEPLAALLARL